MNHIIKCLIALVMISLSNPLSVLGQRVAKVEAEIVYVASAHQTLDQAKATALERAKIQAIADEFGTMISQNNTTFAHNSGQGANVDFSSLSASEVKGEWIETLGQPEYSQGFDDDGNLWIKVKVKGKAREIVSAGIDLLAQSLRNGTSLKYASTEFKDGDDMFLAFRSPVKGHLSVFLANEKEGEVYCILPYQKSHESTFPIDRDKTYVFFDASEEKDSNLHIIDEYTMTCDSNLERNDIFVVFSTHEFSRPNVADDNEIATLTWNDFNKWLSKLKMKDSSTNTLIIPITISK